MIRKFLGWPGTLFFYYLGDFVCKILNLYDKIFESKMKWAHSNDTEDNFWAKTSYFIYKIYSKLIGYSFNINNWAGLNWWKE